MFMGSRKMIEALLTFADRTEPMLWDRHGDILKNMDLQGDYQYRNLRTALSALSVLSSAEPQVAAAVRKSGEAVIADAIISTSARTGFRGRWEKVMENPDVICDIGHNAHGLKYNFAQLSKMRTEDQCSELIIVYGSVADKDLDSVLPLMPLNASYVFTQAKGKRALSAEVIADKFSSVYPSVDYKIASDVKEAVRMALEMAADSAYESDAGPCPLIYIGGSTYVVSEAVEFLACE